MARLIIIGNGYDLAHLKGRTSYEKFLNGFVITMI